VGSADGIPVGDRYLTKRFIPHGAALASHKSLITGINEGPEFWPKQAYSGRGLAMGRLKWDGDYFNSAGTSMA
jgi:hypothetical protein